jgi:Fur family transcriptional regulator, ferric uptake regulator
MKIDKTSFKEQLKEKGYKLTEQRQSVLDVISGHEGEHLSTEEIYELVKETCRDIGLATVYRTLLLLESMELIYKMYFDDGLGRYEINNNKEDHRHHHLICMNCGSVAEVKGDLLESLEKQIHNINGFIVKDHRVKFYGYCSKCCGNTL